MFNLTTFGKYLLLERVNVGGMAEVFKAKTFGVEGFERILAIKRILPNMADDDEFINMFVDEARISVQLSHANIVQIYELGKFENQYYIAMEYVPGRDLRQLLDRLRKKKELLPLPASAFIISKVCDGLDYAHRKTDPSGRPIHVIHRDVSPQNILVSYEGAVKVTDFGIAKAEDRASKTQAGVLKGKFGYMSPEQVRGMEIDHRSDVFAVGILLYEMVTGNRLFIGESDFSTLEKVRNAEVIPPRELNPDIPEELERVMLKALARERDERYQWASELHDDLQQFLIEGNTIFNAKRLAAQMKEEFGGEIEQEMQKMEEFMKVQAPPGMLPSVDYSGVSNDDHAWEGALNSKGESTMIFEAAGGFSDAPTQIADADTDASGAETGVGKRPQSGDRPRTRTGARPRSAKASVSVVKTRPKTGAVNRRPSLQNAKPWVLIGAVALAFVVLLSVVMMTVTGGGDTGTIIVTTSPIDQVDIYLDGTLVASRTPYQQTDIAVGKHKIEAKAAGYEDKAYLFNLVADVPAHIPIEMVPGVGTAGQPPMAGAEGASEPSPGEGLPSGATITLVVETEPSDASIRIAGLPQGTTPRTLTGQDATKPIILELSKPGYKTESKPVSFTAEEIAAGRKVVRYTLVPEGTALASITVDSVPTNASVAINDRRVGITPTKIPNLAPNKEYEVTVSKAGYETFTEKVSFKGSSHITVDAQLERQGGGRDGDEPEGRAARAKKNKGAKQNAKAGGTSGTSAAAGAGAGAGKCGGSGAKLSVMAIGASNCKVSVGKKVLGVAPFFRKPAPTGSCPIKVTCDGGKSYSNTLKLNNGDNEKVIVKEGMWQ